MAYRGQYVIPKRQSRFYLISIIVSIFLSLLALVSYFSGVSSFMGSVVGVILYPVNYASTEIIESVIDVGDYFSNVERLKEENLRLLSENDALLKDKAKAESIIKENEQLYSFLGLKKEFTDLSLVNTKIISRSGAAFMTSFTIDKGTVHGVHKDMPIITADGILGIVSEEGLATSRCISLISHNSSAGVYILRTGIPAVLEGDFALSQDGMCKISGLDAGTDIVVGDYIYTSGYGEIYPRDLCVGSVSAVTRDADTHTLTATVTPTCDLSRADTVMVIVGFERRYRDPSELTSESKKK